MSELSGSNAERGVKGKARDEDVSVELGGLFEKAKFPESPSRAVSGTKSPEKGMPMTGVTRTVSVTGHVVGKGVVPRDSRKFRYDTTRARVLPALEYGATKADRLDAAVAGDLLHRMHQVLGIDKEGEDVLRAFDCALFFEHTINGASMLQPGRGSLFVRETEFELRVVKEILGNDQRRFFRAYADDIADVNREVLDGYDPYNAAACERRGQIIQVAVERGLQKYPYLAHDSSDAGVRLSLEERVALAASKRLVLPTVVNNVDKLAERVPVKDPAG